jgi:hypothetical protein
MKFSDSPVPPVNCRGVTKSQYDGHTSQCEGQMHHKSCSLFQSRYRTVWYGIVTNRFNKIMAFPSILHLTSNPTMTILMYIQVVHPVTKFSVHSHDRNGVFAITPNNPVSGRAPSTITQRRHTTSFIPLEVASQ